MQHLIIKNGYKDNYLRNLKKIHRIEALLSDKKEPINIKSFSLELLKAVFIKKLENNTKLRFTIDNTNTFLINKKLYTSLLLTLCKDTEKIEIKLYNEKILIKAINADTKDILNLIKKLDAIYFHEFKTKNLFILINAEKTSKIPEKYEKDWEYILNPLSVVNIYLN